MASGEYWTMPVANFPRTDHWKEMPRFRDHLIRVLKRTVQATVLMLCGIAVAAAVIFYGEYSRSHWTPAAIWVSLSVFTAVVFAAVIVEFRASWSRRDFWLTILGLLAIHLLCYVALLNTFPEWRIPWFALVSLVEPPVIGRLLDRMGYKVGSRSKSSRKPV